MAKKQLTYRSADISRARPIEWVWTGRLVKGGLNLVVGNEGVGKGTMVAWVLAQLTRGRLQGSLYSSPCNVAVIGNEDSFDHVWTPRLAASGANVKRVGTLAREDLDQIDIRRDLEELTDMVRAHKVKVLYFDQFLDNLAVDADHYHAKQVRTALTPLTAIAGKLDVTVIATLHPNKRADNFRQLVQGSSAFNAVSRSSLLVAEHPIAEDVRVVASGKSNYGQRAETLQFKIVEDRSRPNGRMLKTSRAIGFTRCDVTVEELIESAGSKKGRRATKSSALEKLILGVLSDREWHAAKDVYAVCENEGFYTERAIRRASSNLKVETRRTGYQGAVEWKLPDLKISGMKVE